MAKKHSLRAKPARVNPSRSRTGQNEKIRRGGRPVTLAQARARAPSTGSIARRALVAISPARVGLERRKLELRQEQERRKRIKEYKTTLAIMKKRGVKGLGPKTCRTADALSRRWPSRSRCSPKAIRGSTTPCRTSAAGSSLGSRTSSACLILNLAKAGDEVRYMLGVKERKLLIEQFTKGCPAGGPWDAMLFSGGGNDIVDNPMVLWIRDFNRDAATGCAQSTRRGSTRRWRSCARATKT